MNFNEMSNEEIEKYFLGKDESHLWPVCGYFNVTAEAIKFINDYIFDNCGGYSGVEYAEMIECYSSMLVNCGQITEEFDPQEYLKKN